MRCNRCGNDNPPENRFCGMCGATLLSPPVPPATVVPETQTRRAASAGAAIPSPVITAPARTQEAPRPVAPAPNHEPSISGPSFLGLNDPAPKKRASLSIDPHHGGHSGNLDYLLEDEEHPKRGGAGKILLILALLAVVGGFGYLRWKNGGLPWLTSKQPQTPPAETAADPTSSAPLPATPTATPDKAPASASTQPVAPSSEAAVPPKKEAEANPPAENPPPTTTAPKTDTTQPTSQENASDNSEEDTAPEDNGPAPAPAKPARANAVKPAKTPPPKPSAAAKPTKATDSVVDAQRYLYGKGVPQNCDRGLQLLKPEANRANPKAMIEMGALYSAGLCTPRDLPTAYRWFAQALRKDPDNQAVQTDLQKLWGEMTQPERQLAIKLSQ
jgi:Sel1 repeat